MRLQKRPCRDGSRRLSCCAFDSSGQSQHAYLLNSAPIQITRIAAVGWEHLEVRKQAVIGMHLLDAFIDASVFLIKVVSSSYMAQVPHVAFYISRDW